MPTWELCDYAMDVESCDITGKTYDMQLSRHTTQPEFAISVGKEDNCSHPLWVIASRVLGSVFLLGNSMKIRLFSIHMGHTPSEFMTLMLE